MKSLALSLTLLSFALFGADGNPPPVAVGIYVEFEHPPEPSTRSAVETEAQVIMAPMGFEFQWRDMAAAGAEAWADLAVVSFKGHCDPGVFTYPEFVPGALGWTRVSDGRIQPFAVVDCDRIGAMIQEPLSYIAANKRERLFDRALARVVAHELYHIFAGTLAHERSGVGKAEFTATDLLSSKFHFHKAQAEALRASSARSLRQFSAVPQN